MYKLALISGLAYHVYIMSNRSNGTLYVGISSNLIKRVYQHRTNAVPRFTSRYNLKILVYFKEHATAINAIQREKTLKHCVRAWKIELIEKNNPNSNDLFDEIAS